MTTEVRTACDRWPLRVLAGLVLFLGGCTIGFVNGTVAGRDLGYREAVRHGYGVWDDGLGRPKFRWKTPSEIAN